MLENLKKEAESLNIEITKLSSPDYIARYAREKFMYTKNGELILKIVNGEILTKSEVESREETKKGEE